MYDKKNSTMAMKVVRILAFLLVSQSFIEPLKCQLVAPGAFFTVQSGEAESPSKDAMSLQQEFFKCGMNSQCSDVVTSASEANSEKTEDKVQDESARSGKRTSWKKTQGNSKLCNFRIHFSFFKVV